MKYEDTDVLAARLQAHLAPTIPGITVGIDDAAAELVVYVPRGVRLARGFVPSIFDGADVRVVRIGAVRPARGGG